jgi:hypothetical protein
LVGWLVGQLVVWLVGWLADWLGYVVGLLDLGAMCVVFGQWDGWLVDGCLAR